MYNSLYTSLARTDDDLPKNTPLQTQKKRQIENMKTSYEKVLEYVKDTDYRLPIEIGNNTLTLIILLPPNFPQDGPIIHVSPSVLHPWVNEQQQIVGCTSLKNFTIHSDIGKIIQDVIEEFHKRPPILDRQAQQNMTFNIPLPIYRYDTTTLIGLPFTSGSSFQDHTSIDVVLDPSYHFADLATLSANDLQQLLDDEEKLKEYVDVLPAMQSLDTEMNSMLKQNELIANENLEKQPRLDALKQSVYIKMEDVSLLKKKYEDQNNYFHRLSEQYSPSNIQQNLKIASVQAEEDSEEIAHTFLNGKLDVDEFLLTFLEKRTLYHTRRVKEEKLHNQLQEMQRISH